MSEFIKKQDDADILDFYQLIDNGYLTNFGILWLGDFKQRSKLNYPITVQYIVYDKNENKIRKVDWNLNRFNPKELLLEIEKEAVELNYSFELPDGMFRKEVRHYAKNVVRELLVNAFVHKSFTISGDIFILLYSDRLEIKNAGGLPLGINKDNILHSVQRRNPHLYVQVTIYSSIIDNDILRILDYLNSHYRLNQKEIIAIGAITRNKKISGYNLAKILQLGDDRLRSWVDNLINQEIVVTEGKTKGLMYMLNPKMLSSIEHNLKPSLKRMEEHTLKALIKEDLKIHPKSSVAQIHKRLGDLDISYLRRIIYKMVQNQEIANEGEKKNRVYFLVD